MKKKNRKRKVSIIEESRKDRKHKQAKENIKHESN